MVSMLLNLTIRFLNVAPFSLLNLIFMLHPSSHPLSQQCKESPSLAVWSSRSPLHMLSQASISTASTPSRHSVPWACVQGGATLVLGGAWAPAPKWKLSVNHQIAAEPWTRHPLDSALASPLPVCVRVKLILLPPGAVRCYQHVSLFLINSLQ